MLLRDAYDQNKGGGLPLCPRGWGADIAPEHETITRLQNLLWEVFPRGREVDGEPDDGLFVDPTVEQVTMKISELMGVYMLPHEDAVGWSTRAGHHVVAAAYFQCHTCGYVLPAQHTQKR